MDRNNWNIQAARELYNIKRWGLGYFDFNSKGNVTVAADPEAKPVDLYKLTKHLEERGLALPLLFRFNGILRHRVREMCSAFNNAIKDSDYRGSYIPAYPIKVNQQHDVVEALSEISAECSLGLEVGSKPELIAALAMQDNSNGFILCNGYKDRDYIELALMSKKIGKRPIITIEKETELELILKIAEELGVEPEIGFRLRLTGRGSGRWEKTGGDRAKFGLTISQILRCVHELEKREQLSALSLIHFHIGSQLTNITSLRSALKESTQVYVQLSKKCPELKFLDVGGGLGVDYDGSKTSFESSMNYSLEEYAREVISVVQDVCVQAEIVEPSIITESGRATVAHHSVLVWNVLGIANSFKDKCDPDKILEESDNKLVQDMANLLKDISPKNCQETLHDTLALRRDSVEQFNLGLISIEDRARADNCFWALLRKISSVASKLNYIPEDLAAIPSKLSDTYFCNLSVFQSLPDSWAIEQIFPITPLHRLDERPDRKVVLADITCDSDGKIDRFVDLRDIKDYLPAHSLKKGENYYFAAFLVGAYQEILGDLHNLFGDTNAVHIEIDENGSAEVVNIIRGNTVSDVLSYVQYDKEDLCKRWQKSVNEALGSGSINEEQAREMHKKYRESFDGYTYLRN